MKSIFLNLLLTVVLSILLLTIYIHKDNVTLVRLPPESIADWYKPINKRQVWLHTMFNLRREMQAIDYYSQQNNPSNLKKWIDSFDNHYRQIAQMVPEWKHKPDYAALEMLKAQANNHNYIKIPETLKTLEDNCQSCHNKFQTITAALYRAPKFNDLTIENNIDFTEHMDDLIRQINTVKISIEDDNVTSAKVALAQLETGMVSLGSSCQSCHKFSPKTYPSQTMTDTIAELENSLNNESAKQQSRHLGSLAVFACAECHGSHRLLSSTTQLLEGKQSLLELLQH